METGELRKLIKRELDKARDDEQARRKAADAARANYHAALANVIGPLLTQAANILRAEGVGCQASTPADSARLVADRSPENYIEFVLDVSVQPPRVLGRLNLAQRAAGPVLDEAHLGGDLTATALTDADVLAFLLPAVRRFASR